MLRVGEVRGRGDEQVASELLGSDQPARSWFDAFPDLELTVEDVFGTQEQAVLRMRIRGTQQAPFRGIDAPGAPPASSA